MITVNGVVSDFFRRLATDGHRGEIGPTSRTAEARY
jgi:hypothetical protein